MNLKQLPLRSFWSDITSNVFWMAFSYHSDEVLGVKIDLMPYAMAYGEICYIAITLAD